MIEAPKNLGSESKKSLSEAVQKVSGLYAGDMLGPILGTTNPERRDEIWARNAHALPSFSEKITELRKTLVTVGLTKKAYPSSMVAITAMNFSGVEDIGAKSLLIDVLWARATKSAGYLDYNLSIPDEAEAMAKELNFQDGLRGEQVNRVSLNSVMEALLTDQLKLTAQTKQKGQ